MDLREHFRKFLEQNVNENRLVHKDKDKSDNDESDKDESDLESNKDPTDIAYENDNLRLTVQKTFFKRQKTFKLLDELFLFRIRQKHSSAKMPMLMDILDFLHSALIFVLDSIKSFYKKGSYNNER